MERLIVFALVLLLPTQLAYHFWPQISYLHGLRVDYLSPAVYLTDILIVLLFPYLVKRINLKEIKKVLLLFFLMVPLLLLNIIFAQEPATALLKGTVVFKLVLLGLYFYSCDLKKLQKIITSALSLSLITIFIIGLAQFYLQKTIGGPLYYLGERSFTSSTPGIALMTFFGKDLMRAYSTFSHPNSFAGFVVVAFLVFLSLRLKNKFGSATINPFLSVVVLFSLVLAFSLNAIIGVCLIVALFIEENKLSKLIEKTKVFFPILFIGLSLLFGVVSTLVRGGLIVKENYRERIELAREAIEVFSERPLLGVGLNNFFFVTKSVQPPHNVYLIVLSETGILGTLVLFFWLSKLFGRKLNKHLFLALVFVLFTGFFDHYWFTLHQNQLLLAVVFGLAARKEYSDNLYGRK